MANNEILINYNKSKNLVSDVCEIIDSAQTTAYKSINVLLVQRNWLLGKRIAEEELNLNNQENYGKEIISNLSKELTKQYGKGFTKTNLYSFYNFYRTFPNIFHSLSGKSSVLLSWTHYRILLQVNDEDARSWYEQEAIKEMWSVRTLQRNISSQYYYRIVKSQAKQPVMLVSTIRWQIF